MSDLLQRTGLFALEVESMPDANDLGHSLFQSATFLVSITETCDTSISQIDRNDQSYEV